MAEVPSIRWGIVTTGMISSWFVEDLMIDRPDAPVKHIVQSVGGSTLQKCQGFEAKYIPSHVSPRPKLYDSYEAVYADPEVDIVYIGTPHAFHKRDCLNAIAAGKNILCEKAFTINASEAREVYEAARAKGVYVAEAMWLRHRPLVHDLRKKLFEEKVVGEVFRTFADFAIEVDIPSLPATSRYKDLSLGAGTLLDIGIYSLTWAILTLDPGAPTNSEQPLVLGVQSHQDGIEVSTSLLLHYTTTGRQGIVTSSTVANGDPEIIAKVQGTHGHVEIEGAAGSMPLSFTVYPKLSGDPNSGTLKKPEGKRYDFPKIGRGFIYEADNTALDVLAGRKESVFMPWEESIRVMEILDSVRKQGGTIYPGHDVPIGDE